MVPLTSNQLAALRSGDGVMFWTFSLSRPGASAPFMTRTTFERAITIDGITYGVEPPYILGIELPDIAPGGVTRDVTIVVLYDDNWTLRNVLDQGGYIGWPLDASLWFHPTEATEPWFRVQGWDGTLVQYLADVQGVPEEWQRTIGLTAAGPITSYDLDPTHYATEDQIRKIAGFETSDALKFAGSTQDIPIGRSASN